ncbi:MAG: transposase, partial [Clostridiales bacterium]|nr:transposase [Clostridiales bacterium]
MYTNFEHTSDLQYKVKSLSARVQAFESGEKYVAMRAELKTLLAGKDREIRGLKAALADAYRQTVTQRHEWWGVFEDAEREHKKELARKDSEIKKMEERALRAERQRDDLKDRLKEKALKLYQVKTDLEDERGKGQKLLAQINRDYENSSLPSSRKPDHKKIANNRVKTGKSPGGQPGHKGHGRKALTPTSRIDIPAPEEYISSPNFTPTGKIITKQLINLSVNVIVDEYATPEFRDKRTKQNVHADFPEGVVNDVNYGGSVRAFAYLLNNHCNVSVVKVSDFLAELTGGTLRISTGMINRLSKKFSQKTAADQKRAFADLLLSPVMNVDFTSARVNGKNMNVFVCATPSTVMYLAREHKGHEGVKGTPVED